MLFPRFRMVQYLQLTLLAFLVLGEYLMPIIGIANPPDLYKTAKENKGMVFLICWIGGNTIVNTLLSTGAFEITLNGALCWQASKSSCLTHLP